MSKTLFSPSVNIVRDADRRLTYYPTDNTRRIVSQIIADYHAGIRAFTLIGSYGTGKSAFLWAFEQNILGKQPFFRDHLLGNGNTEVIRFVGGFTSLAQVIADQYELPANVSTPEILEALYYKHQIALTSGRLVILIDEFGKFLEYASQHDTAQSIYFMQELAEFVADPRHNVILVTTVHQNFDAYAFALRKEQRQEWSKVKGRFREITFNEPVEQLLRLAATHLGQQQRTAFDEEAVLQTTSLLNESRAFDINTTYVDEIAGGLFPLDVFSANVLTMSMQRYGQNERSLFSFLQSADHTSLKAISRVNSGFYHLGHVYDYLLFNFYSFLQSKYNPDYAAWVTIRGGLDEIERTFDGRINEYCLLLKSIGLLNLTAAQGSRLDQRFLVNYAKTCLGIPNPVPLIEDLKRTGIIQYVSYRKRFIPNNGTTLDVEAELIRAEEKVTRSDAIASLLQRYGDLPPVLAKSYSFETGTPRLFDFIITDELCADIPTGDVDGFIYLIFNPDLTTEEVTTFSAQQITAKGNSALIYVHYQNANAIKDLLYNLEKLQQIRNDNADDKKAIELIDEAINDDQRVLTHLISGQLYTGTANINWIYAGKRQDVNSNRSFNQLLSVVCREVYPDTPTFWNELVNKHRISSSIFTARRNYLKALVGNWDKPDLGFDKTKYPPEKTIYLTLLKANGISTVLGIRNVNHPDPNRFAKLWKASEIFLMSAKTRRRRVSELYEILIQQPFRLKQGFLDFWIPTFLFLRRDDYALFGDKGYVPKLSYETLELVIKYPDAYELKAFDIEGMKLNLFNSYREILQISDRDSVDNEAFIETIRPFLTFYRGLPDYAKHTRQLSKPALAIRAAIANSTDPEQTFFEDFPTALGYDLTTLLESSTKLSKYIQEIEAAIKEIRQALGKLINRFERFIQCEIVVEDLPFADYKLKLQKRYVSLSQSMVMPAQRVFLQRLNSTATDRDAWLNSLAQAILAKPLDQITDGDERQLYDRFRRMLEDLDNLTNLSIEDIDPSRELAYNIEINSFEGGGHKKLIRVPRIRENQVNELADCLGNVLFASNDEREVVLAALIQLLNQNLNK